MKRNNCILTLILISQSIFSLAQVKDFIQKKIKPCGYCENGAHLNKSPYTVNLKNEIPYFITSAGLLASGLIIKSQNNSSPFTIDQLNTLDGTSINKFDRIAISNNSSKARIMSDVLLYSGVGLPMVFFVTNHHTREDVGSLLLMSLEVFSITNTITFNAKYGFNRTRPLVYNPTFSIEDRTDNKSRLSFFSGHTAQTAAFSVFITKVITDYHPEMKNGVKVGLYSLALGLPAATGYLRVEGGKHYPTDVITGFGIGAAVGWLIPQLHKLNKDSKIDIKSFNSLGANGLSINIKL